MAKRTPRQELRATSKTAPYRREKTTTAPPIHLDLPMPIIQARPTPTASPPDPVAEAVPVAILVPHTGPTTFATQPDFLAVAQSALGFAAAALAYLPGPREIVQGEPTATEPPPGRAPAGDARSLRSPDQFALIYRHGASVISRRGKVGERGAWRVIDYPAPTAAAHAYALECSRLIEQGFRDVD